MFEDLEPLMSLKKLVLRNNYFLPLGGTLLDATNRSVFSLVGQFFPALTELKVDDFFPKKEDYLGLVLGDLADIVLCSGDEKWIEDLDFEKLGVAPGFRSSLCSTLEKLIVEKGETDAGIENYFSITDRPTSVFVLRNLPALILVKFEGYIVHQHKCFFDAIKFLRDHRDIVDGKEQQEFDQVCGEAARRRKAVLSPLSHSRIGTLSLQNVTLTFTITSDVLDTLRAIRVMCPQLKRIIFDGELMEILCDALKSKFEKELKVVLDGWTQAVESIHFVYCVFSNISFMVPVLKAFAPSLKNLHFEECDGIEMTALAVCNQLEELAILSNSSLRSEATDPCSYLTPQTFLPSLKKLNCNVTCLGIWSPLLEGKSTLTHLTLNCCHIKTKAWLNLQSLKIIENWICCAQGMQSTALSAPTILKMIPQMSALRIIYLPYSMKFNDPQATRKVVQHLANRKIPVYIGFDQ